MTDTDSAQIAVLASKVDDLRGDVVNLETAVTSGIETKVVVRNLTDRVVELEDSQRWLTRTTAGALIVAVVSALTVLPF